MNHHIIQRHPILHSRWFPYAAGAVLLLLLWAVFEIGRFRAGYDQRDASQLEDLLLQKQEQLEQSLKQAREQLAIEKRSQEVREIAYGKLQDEMAQLQDEVIELREEVAFYRGIVNRSDAARGLKVQHFELNPDSEAENGYRFKLVLAQVLDNVSMARGRVRLTIEGMSGSDMTEREYEDLAVNSADKDLIYGFKYYQNFEGAFTVPEDFSPVRIVVKLIPRGERQVKLERAFDWPKEENE